MRTLIDRLSAGFWLSSGAVVLIPYVTAQRIDRSHWLAEYATVQWAMVIGNANAAWTTP